MNAIQVLQFLALLQEVMVRAPALAASLEAVVKETDETKLREQIAEVAAGNDAKKEAMVKELERIRNS